MLSGIGHFLRTTTTRVVLASVALSVAATLVVFAILWLRMEPVIEGEVAETVAAEIKGLAEQYRSNGLPGLVRIVEERSGPQGVRDAVYIVTHPSGKRLTGNLGFWPDELQPDGRWMTIELNRVDTQEKVLIGIRAFLLDNGFRLAVGRDMQARIAIRDSLAQAMVLAFVLLTAAALAGGFFLSRMMLARVDEVAATSRRIMAGRLSDRVPDRGTGDAFDSLAHVLNAMLGRVEELMTGMRAVTDSVAHDLRSPLTRLKSRLEEARADMPDDAPASQKVELAALETDRLVGMVGSLLEIARAEAGVSREDMETVDLTALLDDIAELYVPAAEDADLTFRTDVAQDLAVNGQRQLLARAISNLIDNALKYTPPGGRIALTARASASGIEVSVADSGPGIAFDQRERVLQRFVRLDGARSTPGSGLGLSLVAAVATLHGGRLVLDDNRPGLDARFVLPAAVAAPAPEA